jgi:hypothetical protein
MAMISTGGGFLQVAQEVDALSAGGIGSIVTPFGSVPLNGGRVLRVGRSGSLEGRLTSAILPLTHLGWHNEEEAIGWLCDAELADLVRLNRWVDAACDELRAAEEALNNLRAFLEAENLMLLSSWSKEVHGEGALRLFRHGDETLTIWRGAERVQSFHLPPNIWEPFPE